MVEDLEHAGGIKGLCTRTTCKLFTSTCRFGHPDKGATRMLTNSLQVAQRMHKRSPNRRQHPARETGMKPQDSAGWAAVRCTAIHAGTEDRMREDKDKTIPYLTRGRNHR